MPGGCSRRHHCPLWAALDMRGQAVNGHHAWCYHGVWCDPACAAWPGVLFKGARNGCGMPRVPTHTLSMHGGAGAILSVGLLRRVPLEWFEDCVSTTYTTGGDALISICLWQVWGAACVMAT